MERYYISPTPNSGGYYSIIDRTLRNEFGERYALFCYLTKQEAEEFLADTRKSEYVEYATARLEYDMTEANEDAEYGAEWGMWGEAETMKTLCPVGVVPDYITPDWRQIGSIAAFVFDADFVTYKRYPLLDADRIEDQS
ncbi:MAG: hypothetical protein WC455_19035 [Dehalococcoidia bacterium]|jgi:hypothetical protein